MPQISSLLPGRTLRWSVLIANLTDSRITRKMGPWYVWSTMLTPWRWKIERPACPLWMASVHGLSQRLK